MSTPSHHPLPGTPAGAGQPSTQEIPVVPPSPAQGAQPLPPPSYAQPGGTAVEAALPTGPVDFVPGLPGVGTPPPPPGAAPLPPVPPTTAPGPAVNVAAHPPSASDTPSWPDSLDADPPRTAKRPSARTSRDPLALVALGLAALAVALLEVGLLFDFGTKSFWSAVTLWSAFATVSAVLALLAFAAFYPAGNRGRSGPAWRVAAGGLVGLSVFWVLVVLPVVATDRGFVLTAALGCLGAAVWIGPRRKD